MHSTRTLESSIIAAIMVTSGGANPRVPNRVMFAAPDSAPALRKNTVLVKWARRQLQRARGACCHLRVEHVRAHQGVEGNERADSEAKLGAAQPPPQ